MFIKMYRVSHLLAARYSAPYRLAAFGRGVEDRRVRGAIILPPALPSKGSAPGRRERRGSRTPATGFARVARVAPAAASAHFEERSRTKLVPAGDSRAALAYDRARMFEDGLLA